MVDNLFIERNNLIKFNDLIKIKMEIFITSAYPFSITENFAAEWLKESAASDPFGQHRVCDNPEDADVILFAEHHPPQDPYFFQVLRTDIYKKFKNKCFIYHDNPKVLPLLPGVFPSIEKRYFYPELMLPGPYIARLCANDEITFLEEKPKPEFLFSFIGASITHEVRKEILQLEHESCFLKDTSGQNSWELDPIEKQSFESEYAQVSLASQFVLCPRGMGPNSYRLFETMEMGIAPVIISDEWVPIEGPLWEEFSIQVSEAEVRKIPFLLEERRHMAAEMGGKARKAWEEWFSKEVCFHHIAEACKNLKENRENTVSLAWAKIYLQFFRLFHFRNLLRYAKQRFTETKSYRSLRPVGSDQR